MEPSVAKYVCRHLLAWGKHHGGEVMDRGLRLHIDSEIGCGDLLWVVVIAFLFAVITGVLG